MRNSVVIGSRGSPLALTQSEQVAGMIRDVAGIDVRIEIIHTEGDRDRNTALSKIGGKGVFTKELEEALLDHRVDLAVHSLKDLPTELPEGLIIGGVPAREEAADALVCRRWSRLDDLPARARVGTSSLRRSAQLLAFRPDLRIENLRGNVETRCRKVAEGRYDAAVMACAGLRRLGLDDAITQVLPVEIMVPAVGQGALGLEIREDDDELAQWLGRLSDPDALAEVRAERACLHALGGGCQIPMGAHGRARGPALSIVACVCSPDGARIIRREDFGASNEPETLGFRMGQALLDEGAADLIAAQP